MSLESGAAEIGFGCFAVKWAERASVRAADDVVRSHRYPQAHLSPNQRFSGPLARDSALAARADRRIHIVDGKIAETTFGGSSSYRAAASAFASRP